MNLMRVIRAVMKAMRQAAKQMVRVTTWIGGRLVSMLVPAPVPQYDELEDDVAPVAIDQAQLGSAFMPIRNLAYARHIGRMPSPAELGAVSDLEAEWISAMSKDMLKQLLTSRDPELHAHMRGRQTIRGLLRFEEDAIDAYRIEKLKEKARDEQSKLNRVPLKYA